MKKNLIFLVTLLMTLQVQAAVVNVTGSGEIIAAVSVQDNSPTNTIQQAFNEKQSVVLTRDITIDGGTISAGTVVDSHLIFLNSAGFDQLTKTANWEFSGNILGVMSDLSGQLLNDSNDLFASFNDYFTVGSHTGVFNGLGFDNTSDSYSFSANLLEATMRVIEPGDWIRVLTVSQVPVPAAVWLFGSGLLGLMGMRKKSNRVTD